MLYLPGSWLVLPLVLLPGQPPGGARTPDVDRLIRQLGSERFREREAASRALNGLGEPALAALRRAAAGGNDLEIQHRAGKLVRSIEGRVLAEVKESKLGFRDKYRRMSKVIEPGMSGEWVRQQLGEGKGGVSEHPQDFECFPAYGIVVWYDGVQRTKVTRVQQWSE
jgi:hypothetical protein